MGLAGSGLVLQDNAADDLTITADGTFVFGAKLASGGTFDVTVKTQPMAPKQSCVVSGGQGIVAKGNVTTVVVNCMTDRFTIGGTVSGLAGSGLVLQDDAGDPIAVNANGAFAFPMGLADGSSYAVTVRTQPANPRQTCTVTSGSGELASANVTDVLVDCVTDKFSVGGTVLGLASAGLVLQNNGGDDLTIHGDGTFSFPTPLVDLSPFQVTVETQPSGPAQTCTVTGGSGTLAGNNATGVIVNCSTNTYAIGGTVAGLLGSGLVLQNNGGDDLAIGANGTFAFATAVADQSAYDVGVRAQPTNPSQTCTVTSGTGKVAQGAVSNISVTCTTNTYAVGGTLSGLANGEIVVLENGGGDDLTLSANGPFTFPTPVASGATYMATVRTNPSAPVSQTCTVTSGSGTVTNAAVANIAVACVTNRYTVGGTVSGLAGTGLVLRNNGGDPLSVTADGAFTFAARIESGATYDVSIQTQPSSPAQTCVVAGGTGTIASGNVVSVVVNCATDTFTVGGTVSGLDGVGLVLQNNGGDELAINANGSFAFATPFADLSEYAVTVRTQPTSRSQTCTVSSGAGNLAGANVTSVTVTCVTNRYTVGGTVSGLAGTGLVLHNNAGDELPISANGTFTFATSLASGTGYAVTIQAQPSGPRQTCTVTNGTGAVTGSNVTNVAVSCATNTYTVGGTVSGLAGTGLVLRNGGGDDLPVNANGTFTFATTLADLSAYTVTVQTQPTGPTQTCTVANGSGNLAGANVSNVTVTCVTNRYTVGGTVSGLAGTGLVLRNNAGDDLPISANGTFTFATSLASGTSYDVTIQAQPNAPRQTCVVMGGNGTVASGNITSVAVNCTTDRFTIGGTVSGLAGTGLVLRNSGGDSLSIAANGTFAFATSLADLSEYAVTVQPQPTGPSQTCTVANGSGTVAGANVTNVAVSCLTNTYTIGGTVNGLGSGQSVVLQNNGGDSLTVNANGGFTFTTPIASGSAYAVTVLTSPATSTCTVTSGSGTVGANSVTNIAVSCVVNTYSVGGSVSGLGSSQSVVLLNNGTNNLTVSANGSFVFTTPIASGSTYNVTVATNPPGRTCTVANGAGTVTTSAITNVAITCTPNTFTIGGTVSGLGAGESVVLQNKGAGNLTIANGGFTFTTPIASGSTYAVTVLTKPADHACTVTNGSGTVAASNVTNVTVNCVLICVPDCSGKTCGDNGCGGSCGSCPTGDTCSSGMCVPICTPNCSGKTCGDNNCGGSCGSCGSELCHDGVICCVTENQGCGGDQRCCATDRCGNCIVCVPRGQVCHI